MVGCGQPTGAATTGNAMPARGPAAVRPQGTAANRGSVDRPLAGRLLAGKGNRRLRRGSGDDDVEGARGKLGFFFYLKDYFAPLNLENFENCPRVQNSEKALNNSENFEDCSLVQNYENIHDNSESMMTKSTITRHGVENTLVNGTHDVVAGDHVAW
ncbi:hypothetical protein B296_00016480 [Ensete ventricosum]|uniref:Uncharacterized protein n=1 Tax=Ensete ventricosum TaxID=4639 RepID=A0A426ZLS4_ENSVE|nr:hypothetical protein B296_00016480 [Ensete ventricosum]